MKKGITKALAMFCATAMIVSAFSFSVFADEVDEEQNEQNISEEEEPETPAEPQLGGEEIELPFAPSPELNNQEQEQNQEPTRNSTITLDQDYIDNHDGHMPVEPGVYELAENITVSATADVVTQDAQITINLNGHTILYTGTTSMYVLGKVRGTDGDNAVPGGSQSPVDVLITGVVLTINGNGTISGEGTKSVGSVDFWINGSGVGIDKNSGRGGFALIEYGSKLILNGGTITGFEASDEGGAICASNGSEFVMNGGEITNCSAGKGGGAVSGQASSAKAGPNGEDIVAKVTINDGYVHGNEAGQLGGGVRINRCSFYLNGGTITDNNVKSANGGGIEIAKNANLVNGKPLNEVMIQGAPKVYGNKVNGNASADKANIYLESVSFYLSGTLSSEAELYFSSNSTNAVVNIINIEGQTYDISSIKCDKEGFGAFTNGTKISIKYALPKIAGYSVKVGGEILLTAVVDLGLYADDNTSVSYSYAYTKNGASPVDCSGTVAFGDLKASGSNYTLDIPVQSACMTAPIVVTITYSDGTVTGQEVTIEQYAKYIINNSSAQEEIDVAEALLIYGGYAQVQFGINTDALPEINNIDFNNDVADYGLMAAPYAPTEDPDSAFAGMKLSLLSQTEIKLYFKKSVLGDTAPEMTVSYSSDKITATASGNYYVYVIKGPSGNGISAAQYDSAFDYSVGSVNGTISVEFYLFLAKNSSTNQAMVNLAEAYYNFAEKCKLL